MISDANTEAILASLQTAETERGMMRVPLPKMIILDGEILNFRWQRLEELPESSGGDGFHSWDGHSRRRPFADSFSASSKRKSSLPAEKSVSICSSHRLCSRTRNHWTIRRYSSGGRPSIAASISSTRLILGVYHHPVLCHLVGRESQLHLSDGTPTCPTTRTPSSPLSARPDRPPATPPPRSAPESSAQSYPDRKSVVSGKRGDPRG